MNVTTYARRVSDTDHNINPSLSYSRGTVVFQVRGVVQNFQKNLMQLLVCNMKKLLEIIQYALKG